jgi:hypothetical protein
MCTLFRRLKSATTFEAGGVAQVVECLPSKREALSNISVLLKKAVVKVFWRVCPVWKPRLFKRKTVD